MDTKYVKCPVCHGAAKVRINKETSEYNGICSHCYTTISTYNNTITYEKVKE